ncbi:MAG: tripartite tricarboxylate transporter permease [Candidatus Micrarchaeota archaeon]
MSNLFIFICAGILLGILAGLIPGLHSNTLISILSSFQIPDFYLLIILLVPANMIVAYIPSLFFSIPEDGSVVSVLPGHRMTLDGKGLLALKTIILSILLATLISIVIFPLSLGFFPMIYGAISPFIKYIVLLLSAIFVLKSKNRVMSAFVFLLAGTIGYASFNSPMEDPFLPMFTGFFAIPALLMYSHQKIKEQKDLPLSGFDIRFVLIGVVGGVLSDLLPGISSTGQVATFLTIFMPMNTLGYLSAISSIATSQMVLALSTASSLGKARVGGIVWLDQFVDITANLDYLLVLMLFSTVVTCALVYLFRKKIGKLAEFNMTKMNRVLVIYLTAIVFIIDGWFGLGIFALGSLLGYLTIKVGVPRTNLMGAVIVPTLLLLFRVFI